MLKLAELELTLSISRSHYAHRKTPAIYRVDMMDLAARLDLHSNDAVHTSSCICDHVDLVGTLVVEC